MWHLASDRYRKFPRARLSFVSAAGVIVGLVLSLAPGASFGDVVRSPDGRLSALSQPGLPYRGEHQRGVLARHGEPLQRFPTVGGDGPAQPPITRWDYPGFSVIFERSLVIHSVLRQPHNQP